MRVVPPSLRVVQRADGSSDRALERVLFVRAASRSAHALDAGGQCMGEQTWNEVVPSERVAEVLQSLWHLGGIQSLSAAKMYALVSELYVGISLWRRWLRFSGGRSRSSWQRAT